MRTMSDASPSGNVPMTAVCPWCSAPIVEGATECPSCGANLVPDGEPNVPGVTAVDPASIMRSKAAAQPRSRLLSWLTGEEERQAASSKAEAQAVAPPDLEVRREILRLELEAEVANLQAEVAALQAEAVSEGRAIEGAGEAVADSSADGEASETAETAEAPADQTPSDEDPAPG
jgi:hypothetical protein